MKTNKYGKSQEKVGGRRTSSNRKVKFKRGIQIWLRAYESLSDTAEERKKQCCRKWKFKTIYRICLKGNHKLKANQGGKHSVRRREHRRRVRLKWKAQISKGILVRWFGVRSKWKAQISKGILVRWFDKVKATSNVVTEENRERNSNEARTADSPVKEIETANAHALGCVLLVKQDELSRTKELGSACESGRDSMIPAEDGEVLRSKPNSHVRKESDVTNSHASYEGIQGGVITPNIWVNQELGAIHSPGIN
jgi:hypothetical protein